MIYAIYRLADGVVVKHVSCPQRQLARNTPDGCGARAGEVDPTSQRIDPNTLDVVDSPPTPAALAARERELVSGHARSSIDDAERRQARVVREAIRELLPLLPDTPQRADLIARIQQTEDQIAARRGDL